MELTIKNLPYFVFNPKSDLLNSKDQKWATFWAIILGPCTLGIGTAVCRCLKGRVKLYSNQASASKTSVSGSAKQALSFLQLKDQNDVTLSFEDGKLLLVNKELLTKQFPYVQTVFNAKMQEASTQQVNFRSNRETFLIACDFLNSKQLKVTDENFQDLLEFTDYYKLEDLKQHCETWIIENIKSFEIEDLYNKIVEPFRLSTVKNHLALKFLKLLDNGKISDKEHKILLDIVKDLEALDLIPYKNIPVQKLNLLLANCKQLKFLNGCESFNDDSLEIIGTLGALQSLKLERCRQITEQGMTSLAKLTQLQSLDLMMFSRQKTDLVLASLAKLTQLKFLDLGSCRDITDQGLAALDNLTQLWTLKLRDCEHITDQGLGFLASLTQLQSLSLMGIPGMTYLGLASLAKLTQLQSLVLEWCVQINDQGLAYLTSLKELQSLDLALCRRITDQGVASLASLTKLRSLDLTECVDITDRGVASLASLSELQSLSLRNCYKITDKSLASLVPLTKLQLLDLSNCPQVTDQGLTFLTPLTQLQTLYLIACEKITDQGIASLTSLPKLEKLYLYGM